MKSGPSELFGEGPARQGPKALPGGPDQRLGRARRLVRSGAFQEAYSQGRRWIGTRMVLWLRAGDDAELRLGVVASRKVGGAVERTRARRRLREVFRKHRHHLSGKYDVVLVARHGILKARWDELVEEFMELAGRAGLLDKGQRGGG